MKQKKYIVATVFMLLAVAVQAQHLNSAYFTDDFTYRHTMNPAYDNEHSYVAFPALGNINVRTQGNFGYDAVVLHNPLAGEKGQKRMTTFLNPYIDNSTALSGFNKGDNRIVGDVGVTVLSAGFKGFGGFNTIEVNARASFGASLPYELFEFAKNTGNKTYDIGDISAAATSYVELSLGHSHDINYNLRVGAKVKLLLGAGYADAKMENLTADLTDDNRWLIKGNATTDVSMKGFQYKEKDREYNNESRGSYRHVNDVDVDGAGVGGVGLAFDFGGIYKLSEDLTLSASLLDLGFIRWNNDIRAKNIKNGFAFNGFHDIEVNDRNNPNSFESQGDDYLDQLAEFANLTDQGDQGKRTKGIGATLNAGVEYVLPSYRKMSFGLLGSTRFNGDYSWSEARVGANWKPLKWLDGGVSFAVNNFSANMGWVLNIHPKGYNFFIGMDHLLGKMSKEGIPLNSNASVALGMNISW